MLKMRDRSFTDSDGLLPVVVMCSSKDTMDGMKCVANCVPPALSTENIPSETAERGRGGRGRGGRVVQGCSPHLRPVGHAQELDTVQRQRGAHHPPVLHVYGGAGSGEGGGGGGGGAGSDGFVLLIVLVWSSPARR